MHERKKKECEYNIYLLSLLICSHVRRRSCNTRILPCFVCCASRAREDANLCHPSHPVLPACFSDAPSRTLSRPCAIASKKFAELFRRAAINILVDRQVRRTDACRTAEPDPNLVTRARCRPERRVSASAPKVDQLRPLQPEPTEGRIRADLANPKNMRWFLPKWPFSEGRGKESGC